MKKVLIAVLAPALLAAPVALAQATEEPSAQPVRSSAAEFIEKAGKGGMFEVLSSDLALKRAMDGKVKNFAKRMATDHRASNDKLVSTVRSAELPPPPTGLDPEQQEIMDRLSTASGRAFDRAYIDSQIKAHEDAVQLFSTYAREGDNPELKRFAQQVLPIFEDHLKHVQTFEGASPASTGTSK